MKELRNKLNSIAAPISEEDQVVTLLGSLPSSFSAAVTALDNVTMHFVQQQLIHYERKLNSPEAKSVDLHDSVLAGAQRQKSPKCWTTSLDLFSNFVQNETTNYNIEQMLLKTELN